MVAKGELQRPDHAGDRRTMPNTPRHEGIDLPGLLLYGRILRSITAAMQPPRLLIGLLAIAALVAIGKTWDASVEPRFAPPVRESAERSQRLREAIQSLVASESQRMRLLELPDEQALATALLARPLAGLKGEERRNAIALRVLGQESLPVGPFEFLSDSLAGTRDEVVRGVLKAEPSRAVSAIWTLIRTAPGRLWADAPWFVGLYGSLGAFILAFAGLALSRLAAMDLGGHERLRARAAIQFAQQRVVQAVLLLVVPAALTGVLCTGIALPSLLLAAPWLEVIGAVLYGPALLLGVGAAVLLLGVTVGLPILVAPLACDGCDAGEAHQRAIAYLFARPLHYGAALILALAGFAIGFAVVAAVAGAALELTGVVASAISGHSTFALEHGSSVLDVGTVADGMHLHDTTAAGIASGIVSFWRSIVADIVAGYVVAYFFTVGTAIYLMLRRACDGQEIDEIDRAVAGGTEPAGSPDRAAEIIAEAAARLTRP